MSWIKKGTHLLCVKHSAMCFIYFSWTTLVHYRDQMPKAQRGEVNCPRCQIRAQPDSKACNLSSKPLWARCRSGALCWSVLGLPMLCCRLADWGKLARDSISQMKTSTMLSPAALSADSKSLWLLTHSLILNSFGTGTIFLTPCPSAWYIKGVMSKVGRVGEEPGKNGM